MVKKNEEETLEHQLRNKLNNFTPEEAEVYLESLLRKCLEAVIQEDYLTLGSLEDLLNKSIIVLASNIRNFNLFYANLRLKVVTSYLANYINVNEAEAFKFINVLPEYVSLEEANLIANTKAYEDYSSKIGYYCSEYEEIIENEAYSIILQDSFIHINFKGYNELDEAEIGVGEGCYDWADEWAVLKAFVTNSVQEVEEEPSEALKYIQIKKEMGLTERYEGHFERWENYNSSHELKRRKDKETGSTILYFEEGEFTDSVYLPPLESRIYYNKENENFIAIIDYYHLVIIDKRNKNRIVIYNGNNEFLYKFCDYCLGIKAKKIELPEEESSEDGVPEDVSSNN